VTARILRAALLLLLALGGLPARAQTGWGLGLVNAEFYFTDLTRGRVVKLDRTGRVHALIEDVHCHNLAPGYDGLIYGEAVGANSGGMGDEMGIWCLTTSGERSWLMPPTAPPIEGFWIARDALGNSYAWQGELGRVSRIVKRTPIGEVIVLAGAAWGQADGRGDAAQFGEVGGLAVTRDGSVYVADSGHLRRLDPDGVVQTLARDLISPKTGGVPGRAYLFNHSVGLAASEDGVVYLADHYNRRVVRWDHARGATVIWDAENWLSRLTGGGIAWYPGGVAFAGPDAYVLEVLQVPGLLADLVGSPQIRRISPDGSSTLVASVTSAPLRLGVAALVVLLVFGPLAWWRRSRARSRIGTIP
jgi:hypothetical protein